MKQYNVDYYINKFEAIPEENWCVGMIYNKIGNIEQKCALGHCLIIQDGHVVEYPEESTSLCRIQMIHNGNIVDINNGKDSRYKQDSPKKRILAFFYEAKYGKDMDSAVKETQEIVNTEVLELI